MFPLFPLLTNQMWEGRWRVIPHDVLPDWLKDNDFLLHGHRPPMPSFRACFKSIFRIHTETGNIWTHLLGKTHTHTHAHTLREFSKTQYFCASLTFCILHFNLFILILNCLCKNVEAWWDGRCTGAHTHTRTHTTRTGLGLTAGNNRSGIVFSCVYFWNVLLHSLFYSSANLHIYPDFIR